jgi:hypothetical protein
MSKVIIDGHIIDTELIVVVEYQGYNSMSIMCAGCGTIYISRESKPNLCDIPNHEDFGYSYTSRTVEDRLDKDPEYRKLRDTYKQEVNERYRLSNEANARAVREMYDKLMMYWSPGNTKFPDLTVK